MPNSLYMLGEHFKNKGAAAVCRPFRDRGRMAPEGRTYLSSWVDEILRAAIGCMATEDLACSISTVPIWPPPLSYAVRDARRRKR